MQFRFTARPHPQNLRQETSGRLRDPKLVMTSRAKNYKELKVYSCCHLVVAFGHKYELSCKTYELFRACVKQVGPQFKSKLKKTFSHGNENFWQIPSSLHFSLRVWMSLIRLNWTITILITAASLRGSIERQLDELVPQSWTFHECERIV